MEGLSLYEALRRHSRFTKEIARRNGYDPVLTLVLRDPADPSRTLVYTEEPHPKDAMEAIQLFMLGALQQEALS